MSIEAMKRLVAAVEAIPEEVEGWMPDALTDALIDARQAIAEAEKKEHVGFYDAENKDLRQEIPMGEDGDWWQPVYINPQPNVTTSDMKQEHVAKTAKQRHEENT